MRFVNLKWKLVIVTGVKIKSDHSLTYLNYVATKSPEHRRGKRCLAELTDAQTN